MSGATGSQMRPVALRFHRRVAATSNSTPAGSRSSAKIRVNRCAQGVLIATPSRVAKLHRHQVGFDLRELLIDMARYLQRGEHFQAMPAPPPYPGKADTLDDAKAALVKRYEECERSRR